MWVWEKEESRLMMMESELWNQEGLTHAAQLAFWKDRQVLVCVCSTHKVVRSIYLHVWVNLGVNLCPTEHEAIIETWFLEYSQGEIISCFNHPLLSLSVCLSYELGWHYLFPFGMVGTQNKNSMKVPRSWQILLKKQSINPIAGLFYQSGTGSSTAWVSAVSLALGDW